jgi:hypothetical protein
MNVKTSKNLTYQKFPTLPDGSDVYSSPVKSIIEKFDFSDVKLVLYFKNRYIAEIRAKNLEGQRELNLVAKKLKDFIGKPYEEILNFDF